MLRIGEFSNLSQVSVKTLHHYDDIGLLRPAYIDAQTGYRYYEAVQLTRLIRIRVLKDIGFSLDDITLLLRPNLAENERAQIIARRREDQEKQVSLEQQRLARLQRLVVAADGEPPPPSGAQSPVFFKSVPAMRVAAWRASTPCRSDAQMEQEITARFIALSVFLQTHGIRATGVGVMLWHDSEWQEEVTDVEVAIPIEEGGENGLPPHPKIRVSELPPIPLAACVTYRGNAQDGQAQAAYVILADALQSQGFQLDGLRRDVTLHYDFATGDRVVEVQFPIAEMRNNHANGS